MSYRLLVPLCLLVGCEKDLLATVPDAAVDAPVAVDAPDMSRCMAPMTDAHPAAMYTLFVNFDGVTLKPCAAGDARTNCTPLVTQDTVFPPFMEGNAARDAFIASILYAARKGLAPYSIDIVTTRPATGNYYMMVVGGTPALIGGNPQLAGLAPQNCSSENRNNVSLTFDRGQAPTSYDYANSILSDMGIFAGIGAANNVHNDCLCRTLCGIDDNKVCNYGMAVPTDPQVSCGRTTQDEPALMQAAYGCR